MILCGIGDMRDIIVYLSFTQRPEALSEFKGRLKVTGPPVSRAGVQALQDSELVMAETG